jgi:hypothetical protein
MSSSISGSCSGSVISWGGCCVDRVILIEINDSSATVRGTRDANSMSDHAFALILAMGIASVLVVENDEFGVRDGCHRGMRLRNLSSSRLG